MPYPLANLSKRTVRGDIATVLGDNFPFTTTSGGSTTTAVVSSFIGMPIASFQNKYVLIESGNDDSTWRVASSFAPTTGTITVRRAYANTVATSVDGHVHEFSPELYTRAINDTIRQAYPAVYRPVTQHFFTRNPGLQRSLPLARNMERVMLVKEDQRSSSAMHEYFNVSDSLLTAGSNWTAAQGTWGITGQSVYAVSDTDGDLLIASPTQHLQDGVIEVPVRGDTTGAASRTLLVVFRATDDYTAALGVRLLNNAVDLRRLDGGSWTTISTAAVTTTEDIDYVLRVMFNGTWIDVWVDDVWYLHYQLLGTDTRYLGYSESGGGTYGNFGLRLEKTGVPSLTLTHTLARHFFAHAIVGTTDRGDWMPHYDRRMIELNNRNRGRVVTESKVLWLEGTAELSQLAADTFETLVSDSTATVEIEQNDPAYSVLVQWAAYLVLDYASSYAFTINPEKRAEYADKRDKQLARAISTRRTKAMPYQMRRFG